MNIFDFINDLNFNKKYIFDYNTKTYYNKYMINKFLSYNKETVLYANEMNIKDNEVFIITHG